MNQILTLNNPLGVDMPLDKLTTIMFDVSLHTHAYKTMHAG